MRIKIKYQINEQGKSCYEKSRGKLFHKRNYRYINYKELHRPYIEIQNKLIAWEEKSYTQQMENWIILFY